MTSKLRLAYSMLLGGGKIHSSVWINVARLDGSQEENRRWVERLIIKRNKESKKIIR